MRARGRVAPVLKAKPVAAVHRIASLPVPVGGINTMAPYNATPQTDCLQLENWIPTGYGLKLRQGWGEWAVHIPEAVSSIVSYLSPAQSMVPLALEHEYLADNVIPLFRDASVGPRSVPTGLRGKLFAVTDKGIYDVTNSSTSSPTKVYTLSGTTNAGRVEGTQFVAGGGTYLAICSETDGYLLFDGTTWTKPVAGTGAGQVNGVDPATLVFCMEWKRRLFFVQRNSTVMWIADLQSITGTFTSWDFGAIFEHGGALDALATWTVDAGSWIDDYFIAISTEGDLVVYKGNDPTLIGAFTIVGTWFIGRTPRGRRYFDQFGGDVVFLSSHGLNPVSYITRGGTDLLRAEQKNYTAKIQNTFQALVAGSLAPYGWEVKFCPTNGIVVIGQPPDVYGVYRQWALSTTTFGWTRLVDMPATCWWTAEGYTFFGTADGRVCLAFAYDNDAVPISQTPPNPGNPINGFLQTAFSYFDVPGAYKQFLMVRPTFLAPAKPAVRLQVNHDFVFQGAAGVPAYTQSAASVWDTAVWDAAIWGGALNVYQDWVDSQAIGYCGSLAINSKSSGELDLASIDYMLTVGGPT